MCKDWSAIDAWYEAEQPENWWRDKTLKVRVGGRYATADIFYRGSLSAPPGLSDAEAASIALDRFLSARYDPATGNLTAALEAHVVGNLKRGGELGIFTGGDADAVADVGRVRAHMLSPSGCAGRR